MAKSRIENSFRYERFRYAEGGSQFMKNELLFLSAFLMTTANNEA